MLLVLTESIREALPRVLASAETRDALSNLARAYREGLHLVQGSAALLSRLAEARELPEDVRGTYRQIKLHRLDVTALRAGVSHLCEIEAEDGAVRDEGDDVQRRFHVPLAWFAASGRSQKARLIGEHQDDARVYEHAGEAYQFRNGPRGITIQFQRYGGGGSTTAEALADHAREGLTLCIVDADFRWSHAEAPEREGETAARVRRAARTIAGRYVYALEVAPCREVENLISGSLILACLLREDNRRFTEQSEIAARIGLFGGGPEVNRLDLKEGLRRWDYEALPDGPARRYLQQVFERTRGLVPRPARGFCGAERRCPPEKEMRRACECVVFEGLGEHFLHRIAEELGRLTPQKVAEHLFVAGQPSEPHWSAVGRVVFSWGCARPRIRT